MGGFLDPDTRIVDMVLTNRGRELQAQGNLTFVYWAAFDDEIDYSPALFGSGSLTAVQLSESIIQHIEHTPVREATFGRLHGQDSRGLDQTNVSSSLFTMPHGSTNLPRMTLVLAGTTGSVESKQSKLQRVEVMKDQNGATVATLGPYDLGYTRSDASALGVELGYAPGSWPADYVPEGFLLEVHLSGVDGQQRVAERRDSSGRAVYMNDLSVEQR